MAKKYVERVIVRLTAAQVAKLKELSEETGKNTSDVIRMLIEEA
jgi:predicted DNA-binding protein